MMCEGGKIDWACHANDAGATVNDTLALADAVQVAIDFAKEHADETLILVTGDHETGGLTMATPARTTTPILIVSRARPSPMPSSTSSMWPPTRKRAPALRTP